MNDGRPRVTRAEVVNQHPDGHAPPDGALECRRKLFSGAVMIENVGRERNGFGGGFDRGEHGRESFITVDEHFHLIAGGQRACADAIHQPGKHAQMRRLRLVRLAHVLRNRTANAGTLAAQ